MKLHIVNMEMKDNVITNSNITTALIILGTLVSCKIVESSSKTVSSTSLALPPVMLLVRLSSYSALIFLYLVRIA